MLTSPSRTEAGTPGNAHVEVPALFAALPQPALLVDAGGAVLAANERFAASGLKPNPANLADVLVGSDRPSIPRALAGETVEVRAHADTPDGFAWVQLRARPLDDGSLLVLLDDLNRLSAVSGDVRNADQRYRALVEGLPITTFINDFEAGQCVYASPQIEQLTGYKPTEMFGERSFTDLIHPEDKDTVYAAVDEAWAKQEPVQLEYRIITGDGSVRWVRSGMTIVRDGDGKPYQHGYFLDITDRHELEEKLRQSQKMEALGRMAGGVAHDFNNALMAIRTLVDLSADESETDDNGDAIREIAEHASALTKQLLAFSRHQGSEPAAIDLNDAVTGAARMLRPLLGEVQLDLQLAPTELPIFIDAAELTQVLVNLALNGRDALGGTGLLTISTRARGGRAELSVRDEGEGMTQDVVDHMFDPFFTTKQLGGGTGLGLSVVYGIASRAGATIEVDSAPGVGTTVRILFAALAPPATARPLRSVPATANGSCRVLLVEDDDVVRSALERFIARRGYDVVAVPGGAEALAALDEGRFDALVTDVSMPGMSGRELVERIRSSGRALPTIFISGYPADEQLLVEIAAGARFMSKPFPPSELVELIEATVAAAADAAA